MGISILNFLIQLENNAMASSVDIIYLHFFFHRGPL